MRPLKSVPNTFTFLLCLFFARNSLAQAETTAQQNGLDRPSKLTLGEAKQIAFRNNWDLLAAKTDVALAIAQNIVAQEFPNPTLSFSNQKINTDGQPNGTAAGNDLWHRRYDTIVAVNQLFEIGGKRLNRQRSAQAGWRSARARLFDARRVLEAAVTKAYVAALLAQANVEVLQQSARSLRQEAKIAETRLQAGDISSSDRNQIEIAASRLELDAKKAEGDATTARIVLEVLLGRKSSEGNWLPGETLDSLAVFSVTANESNPGALRPDLLAAEAALQKAEAELRLARAQRIPDPTLLAQFEHQPPDQPNTIGLGVSFPLPLWNHNRGAIKSGEAARDQAAIQLQKTRGQIFSEIKIAGIAYENARARWERYDREIRPKSEEVRKTVAFAYEKGGASLLDLLTAERNDNDVRLATAHAQAESASAAADLVSAQTILNETELRTKESKHENTN